MIVRNLILASALTMSVGTTTTTTETTPFRDEPQNAESQTQIDTSYQRTLTYTNNNNWTNNQTQFGQEKFYIWYKNEYATNVADPLPIKSRTLKEIEYIEDLDQNNAVKKLLFNDTLIRIDFNLTANITAIRLLEAKILGQFTVPQNYYTTQRYTVKRQWGNSLTTQQKNVINTWIENTNPQSLDRPSINTSTWLDIEEQTPDYTELGYDLDVSTNDILYFYIQLYYETDYIPSADAPEIYRSYELDYLPSNITIIYRTTWTGTYTINQEVINLPGLLFDILTMPFAFISTAFNLTLFPNTPYAINISHIFWAFITGFIFIFIIKKVLK